MPDAGAFDEDEVLRFHTRLERLSVGTARKLARDLDAIVGEIRERLTARSDPDETFSVLRLRAVLANLAAYRDQLKQAITDSVNASITVTIETSAPALVSAGFISTVPPVSLLARIGEQTFDGRTWTRWGIDLAEETIGRIESDLRRSLAAGESIRDAGKRLQATLGLSKVSAEKLARTSISAVSNAARIELIESYGADVVTGWQFVATLDGRTSKICSGLDGRIYKRGDPNLPRPPRHPNCRSVLVPKTALSAKFEDRSTRASKDGPISAKVNFEEFLQRQSTEFQREWLGPTRYRAWKRGLPIGDMATADRELTISELRALYPDKIAA